MFRHRRFLPVFYLFAVAVLVQLASPASAQFDAQGKVMIYLEVPAEVAAPTMMHLAALVLEGPEREVRLEPAQRELLSRDLAGRQILLAEARLPAALYEHLSLVLADVRTDVDAAPVSPDLRPEGYGFDVNTTVVPGGGAAIFLRWRPALEAGDIQPYFPAVEVLGDRTPPLGSQALVTCRGTGTLVVVDRKAGRVVRMIQLGEDPRDMVYSRARQKIFVALAGEDAIAVVDGMSLQVERKVSLRFGDEPDRLALSADQANLYVLNPGSRSLAVLGTWSLQERTRVTLGNGPRSLTVDPESGYVYVACEDEGQVQVINASSGVLVSVLTPTAAPSEIMFDEISRQLFVGSSSQRRIFTYDLAEGRSVGSQTICGTVSGLAFNPGAQQLFAALPDCREVAVLRPAAGLEFASLPMPAVPGRLIIDPDRSRLLVLLPEDGMLAVCLIHRGTVESLLKVGDEPYAVVAP